MNIFGLLDYLKMKASPKICLLLFGMGIVYCIGLDMLGVGTLTPRPVSGFLALPVPDYIILPALYFITAFVVGLLSKRRLDAIIYAASLGQIQLFMPFLLEVLFFHTGSTIEIMWRMLCGLPLTFLASVIAFSIKSLFKKSNR